MQPARYNPAMHRRRFLTLAVRDALAGIPGIVGAVRLGHPLASANAHELPSLFVYNFDGKVSVIARNLPTGRPTDRTFRIIVGAITSRAAYEGGALDEIAAEMERRVFSSQAIRQAAPIDVSLAGETFDPLDGSAVSFSLIFDFTARMTEGTPEISNQE